MRGVCICPIICPFLTVFVLFFIFFFPYFSVTDTFQKNFCYPIYPNAPPCVQPEATLSPLEQIIKSNVKVVFLKKSVFYCFNKYGDCPEDEFPPLPLISCIEDNITKGECNRLFESHCGVQFGCSLPSACNGTVSPWCTFL